MGLREDIMAYKPNTLDGTNYSFIDGDTLENGESFTTKLLEAGAMDLTDFTSKEDKIRMLQAQGERSQEMFAGTYTPTAFDKAAFQIKNAELEEGAKSRGFRDALSNEAERMQYINYFMNSKGVDECW